MKWITGSGLLLLGVLGGCSAPETHAFAASPERVREAVKAVLARCPDLEEEGDVIRTGYCTEPIGSRARQSAGLIRERHEVRIVGSTIEVSSTVEERGPHGHGRHRWEGRPSAETEKAVIEAVARRLGENP